VRPHPVVWRGVLAISVLYEMFLVYLLFQNVDDARQLFKHINPSLGVPLPEKSYAENCSFDFETVWEGVDVFVVAHAVGWWAKALILRDFWMTWIISIMFEVMEYSLEHHLPNFAEVRFFFTNGIIIFFFTLSKKKKVLVGSLATGCAYLQRHWNLGWHQDIALPREQGFLGALFLHQFLLIYYYFLCVCADVRLAWLGHDQDESRQGSARCATVHTLHVGCV